MNGARESRLIFSRSYFYEYIAKNDNQVLLLQRNLRFVFIIYSLLLSYEYYCLLLRGNIRKSIGTKIVSPSTDETYTNRQEIYIITPIRYYY